MHASMTSSSIRGYILRKEWGVVTYMNENVLVIGGGGFVGSYLVNHLSDDLGMDVTVTKIERETLSLTNAKVVNLNILNKDEIVKLLDEIKPEYIIHLAAQSSVSLSWANPGLTIDINIKGCVNLLDAIRESRDNTGVNPRVLMIGSGEEYGHIRDNECPIIEDNNTRPGNIYAATKACQNMIGKIYADAYKMDVFMVRAFNHTGPNQAPLFVVADFCKQVAEIEKGLKEPVLKVGNLSAKRDFTDVRDVVRAYGLLIMKGERGETYNVGTGKAVAIQDILDKIVSKSKVDIKVEVDPNKLRPVDVPIIEPDISKINTLTGWKPEIDIDRTIEETLNYWREKDI